MYGAILGDIVGSPYEHDKGEKSKQFEFWNKYCWPTDDTIMTLAVCSGLLRAGLDADDFKIKQYVAGSMHYWGKKYPNAGYGSAFKEWLEVESFMPYGSYGNGSAMRVSSVGWLFNNIDRVRHVARLTASVSHDHPEGIKGAECVAAVIFLARTRHTKNSIKKYVINNFGYDLSRTCDEIRPTYKHDGSCQGTVPEAITAFLEGTDFEDVIRTAVSLGGDTDTLACIAGGMAEAFYGIPPRMKIEVKNRLNRDGLRVCEEFEANKK